MRGFKGADHCGQWAFVVSALDGSSDSYRTRTASDYCKIINGRRSIAAGAQLTPMIQELQSRSGEGWLWPNLFNIES